MQILNIAGYKFVTLNNLETLRAYFLTECRALSLKGTILLSREGINLSLAGTPEQITSFQALLRHDPCFANMPFRKTHSHVQPFKRMKVKLKKEIITLRDPSINPVAQRAQSIAPEKLKTWLDEARDITLLDTRNDYETQLGSFKGALDLQLKHFTDFPAKVKTIDRNKPVVMFCTGGIRCEKAALHMLNEGYTKVYQLEGGILNYFEKIGKAHYSGECFVFDERVSVAAE